MRIPRVTQRSGGIAGASAQALRTVFAGFGRVFLAADRLRGSTQGRTDETDETARNGTQADGPPAAESPVARFRTLDQTGNVRLISPDDPAPAAAKPAPAEPEPAQQPEPALPEPEPTATLPEPEPEPAAPELPVPNYDELSLPSLRARLRNLDPAQLRVLADYERAHAARPDVITMFERRITKLVAE
jgi:hypothetical protein